MKTEIKPQSVFAFFKNNWFKISLAVLALYVWFKKDMTLQVNLGSPDKTEQKALPTREKFTDTGTLVTDKAGVVDKLELPFTGNHPAMRDAASEFATISEADKHAYLERFAKVALAEQKKYDIPASIILATALYQSSAGRRDLALNANNQFALPCDGEGPCTESQGRRYRRYESAWASFRDFSLFASRQFSSLRGEDYQGWAKGMKKAGFGETDGFEKELIRIIEGYRLYELDK